MALNRRNTNPFAAVDAILYMLIDKTVVEQIHVVMVGDMKHIQLHGKILEAEGKTVIGPVVAGRSLAKLSKLELQYLYWSLSNGQTPTEDYAQLIQDTLGLINQIEPTKDSLIALQLIVDNKVPQPQGPKVAAPVVRPKGTTTTGIIWAICDEVLEDLYEGKLPTDWKELRAEVATRCRHEGFAEGTLSVQYSKWKKAKSSVTQNS
jgi:hypothetical protein